VTRVPGSSTEPAGTKADVQDPAHGHETKGGAMAGPEWVWVVVVIAVLVAAVLVVLRLLGRR
jgi:hypothetical protein